MTSLAVGPSTYSQGLKSTPHNFVSLKINFPWSTSSRSFTYLLTGPVVTRYIHSIITLVWGGLMERTSRAVGLTQTRPQSQRGKWVPVLDTQHLTATGGVGTGKRSLGSVSGMLAVYDLITNAYLQEHFY